MSGNIVIENAVASDLPAIKPLLLELIEAMEDTEGFEIETAMENCARLLGSPGNYMLVAREQNRVVGFVNFSTRRTIWHPAPSGLIEELVVTKDNRGMGTGKQLVQAVMDKCRELGCCEVEVSTEASNAEARKFYNSCGFEGDAILFETGI